MSWLRSILISGLLLVGLRDFPVLATLLASTIMCVYCAGILHKPVAAWVYVYPVACYLLSQGFTGYTFFDIGDGPAYFAIVNEILPRLHWNNVTGLLGLLALAGPKYLNIGFLPTALLPDSLFTNADEPTYQLTQAYVHVALVGLLLYLTVRWAVISAAYRIPIFLFMLVSPGYLALVSYPTRHHITSFGTFLLFISLEACLEKRSAGRLAALGVALSLVFLCKVGLLPFALLYGLVRLYQPGRFWVNSALGGLLLVVIVGVYRYVSDFYNPDYGTETIGVFRNAYLGPVLPVYKYVMAIVSPFPYYKYGVVVNTIAYGGNWLLLTLFIPAGMIGLWLFYRMMRHPLRLWRYNDETKRLFGYGGILSLSILGGSTGFLMYILICMPFFAPLFVIDKYNVPFAVVLLTLVLMNVAVLLMSGDNLFDYL